MLKFLRASDGPFIIGFLSLGCVGDITTQDSKIFIRVPYVKQSSADQRHQVVDDGIVTR